MIKNVQWSSFKVTAFLFQILMKLEYSPQFFFEKYSNIKFRENPYSGSRGVPCGLTDGRTELIVVFRNFEKSHKKLNLLSKQCIYVCHTIAQSSLIGLCKESTIFSPSDKESIQINK
jgi:hypothetical protein